MRFEITYRSDYRYDAPVAGNHDRLRMRPTSGGTQRAEHFDVRVDPEGVLHQYEDLFGNQVVELLVAPPHQHLRIEIDALVATTDPLPPPHGTWADLRTDGYREAAGIHRFHVRPIDHLPQLDELAEAIRADSPAATVDRVRTVLRDRLTYQPGVTTIETMPEDVLALGAGVCQDFAHLGLRLLRDQDIAARYVSGYFFTTPDAGGASAEVDTHAWLEALLPAAGEGDPVWHAIDPTNGIVAGAEHVKIGHGRWYGDVPPIEGTFSGQATSAVEAHVQMRKIG